MGWISDIADEDSFPEASSSKIRITNGASCPQNTGERFTESSAVADNENLLADFAFDKLPTELLVKIFHHARADSVLEACATKYPYPVALAQVCHHWRNMALGAPTLWTDIRIVQYGTEETREAARVYLERSKTCPIFLTWFADPGQSDTDIQGVIHDLITPGAERWQRITLLAGTIIATDALRSVMQSLDFPILQDVEISCTMEYPPSNRTFYCNTPLLRRCRFNDFPSLPPLPPNLVVLDCIFSALELTEFDLDPLLEFLPHVAHSLEHLRFGPPSASKIQFTPRTSRIPLEHLKSLLIRNPCVIMDHILTSNLTHFAASHLRDVTGAAETFENFSAPMLRSIQFHDTALLQILKAHNFPSMFPQLESITLHACTDESAFALLLEPPEPKKSSPSQKASRHLEVQNPFPNLKELTISDMTTWTSFEAVIEKRLKNGDRSLRKIRLPKVKAAEAMSYLCRWLSEQGIELVLYEPGKVSTSTPEFQDDFCDDEARLFREIMEPSEHYEFDWDIPYDYSSGEEEEVIYCWNGPYDNHNGEEEKTNPYYDRDGHYDDYIGEEGEAKPCYNWDEPYDDYNEEEEEANYHYGFQRRR